MAYQFASDLLATVNDKIMPGVADQVGTYSEMLNVLTSSGRTDAEGRRVPQTRDELLSPDEYVRVVVRHTRGASRGSYKGYDLLPTAATRQLDAAKQNWFEYNVAIPISDDEEIAARGAEATVRLWEERLNAGFADMADLLATGVWNSAASKTGMQAKGLDGFRLLGTANRTWMGIDSTSYSWWDPGLLDDAGSGVAGGIPMAGDTAYTIAQLTDPTHDYYILKLIRNANLTLSLGGNQRPKNIVTTKTIWGYIANAVEERQRLTTTKSPAGVESITFDGLEISWDSYCPDYHMAFLAPDGLGGGRALGLKGRQGRWFYLRPPVTPENQMAKVAILVCHAILYCDQPRLQGLFTSLGAS
jgi:hypothetical protein